MNKNYQRVNLECKLLGYLDGPNFKLFSTPVHLQDIEHSLVLYPRADYTTMYMIPSIIFEMPFEIFWYSYKRTRKLREIDNEWRMVFYSFTGPLQ